METGRDPHVCHRPKRSGGYSGFRQQSAPASGHVKFSHRRGCRANSLRLIGRLLPQHVENALLDFQNLFFGGQNLVLIHLEFGRSKALGIHQRLLAFVIGGRKVLVSFRNLDVVAKDIVEAHLKRCDTGSLAFARLDLRNELTAVLAEVPQFVKFGIIASADSAAIGDVDRRAIGKRADNRAADFGHRIQPRKGINQTFGERFCSESHSLRQFRHLFQGTAQSMQVARALRWQS